MWNKGQPARVTAAPTLAPVDGAKEKRGARKKPGAI